MGCLPTPTREEGVDGATDDFGKGFVREKRGAARVDFSFYKCI